MDGEATSTAKHHCCKNNRKIFTVLVVTSSLFFILWNLNIPYSVSMSGGDIFRRNISEYIYFKNIYTNENNTIPPPIAVTVVKTTVTTFVNPHDYKYIILENSSCSSENGSVFLMVVVCVAPANFKQRMTVRETWGSVAKTNKEIRLIFMIGKTLDVNVQNQIMNESSYYHDIVQEDFIDSYRNLSYKSVAMLKWKFTYCPSAKYVLKADDDMFVNVEYLLRVLKQRPMQNTVIGMKIIGAKPIQDKNSKWYTPKGMFNGSVYPPYCSGTSYVISGDIVEKLYNTSLVTPYFWLEDIYITGILRTTAKVKIFYDYGFTYDKPPASGCVFRKRITGHRYSELEIRKIWKELTDTSLKCA